jgi:predicted dehydrogenase
MRKLRTVLVGFGAIAHGLSIDRRMAAHFRYATHAQVLRDHPRFDWCGTVDPDPKARARARAASGGEVFATLDAAQAAIAPEVAVIAAPPTVRAEVLRALPGLRGAIVEKPLGADLASAVRFAARCERMGLAVQVCFWRRADRTLRRLAADRLRTLGAIQAGFALYGNGLRNNGVHLVDLVRMQAGEIVAVRALGPAMPLIRAPIRGDVQLAAALHLDSGAVVSMAPLDFAQYREVALDLWGTKARRAFDQETLRIVDYSRTANRGLENAREIASDRPRAYAPGAAMAFFDLYGDLAKAIATGGRTWSDAANALRAETVVAALLRSAARGGARIELPPP